MSGSISRETEKSLCELSVSLSLESTVRATCTYQVTDDTWIHGVAKAGIFGYLFNYGVKTRISNHTIVKANVVVGSPAGTFSFKIFYGL